VLAYFKSLPRLLSRLAGASNRTQRSDDDGNRLNLGTIKERTQRERERERERALLFCIIDSVLHEALTLRRVGKFVKHLPHYECLAYFRWAIRASMRIAARLHGINNNRRSSITLTPAYQITVAVNEGTRSGDRASLGVTLKCCE